jgi:ABC-type branched-subunit amino acid transport system ATPase component
MNNTKTCFNSDMTEITKLFTEFYNENSHLINLTIFLSFLSSSIDTIIVPRILAATFNNINDINNFRENIIKLLLVVIISKIVYSLSTYYKRQLDPEMTRYIIVSLIKKIFHKYEYKNELTNVSVLINRIQMIKRNIIELTYIMTNVFIPRTSVIIIACYSIFMINKKLGLIIFLCLLFQVTTMTMNLTDCICTSYIENENKDSLFEYIEDLFYNIDTIELTPNGFKFEIENIMSKSQESKNIEQTSLECVTNKQYSSYFFNFVVTCIMFYNIYDLYEKKEIQNTQITTTLLLLTGMFDNIGEISYYIPDATSKLGTLMKNEDFLKNLKVENETNIVTNGQFILNNADIKFTNVSFKYENHKLINNLTITIPENSFICLYGPSGSGKSTFIRLIFGIEKPSEGIITIGGNDISKFNIREFRKYISYINQNTTNLFNTTVYKNIIYGYEDFKELKEEVKNIFIKFGFYDIFKNLDENKSKWSFLDEEVGKLGENLSGGQKQIIHLLRLTLNDTSKIVILDEPSSALDDKTRESASKYIKYLKSKQKTILLITHDEYYKNICDSILKFSNNENPVLEKVI